MSDEKKTTQLTGAFYLGGQRLDTSHAETMEYVRSRFAAKPAQRVEAVNVPMADLERALLDQIRIITQQRDEARAALAHPRPTGELPAVDVIKQPNGEYQVRVSRDNMTFYAGIPLEDVRQADFFAESVRFVIGLPDSKDPAPTGEQAGEVVAGDMVKNAHAWLKLIEEELTAKQFAENGDMCWKFDLRKYVRLCVNQLAAAIAQPRPMGVPDGPLTGKYADVLVPFVALMDRELHANAGKGDRPGWLCMTPEAAVLEVHHHVAKLQKAVLTGDQNGVREYAADVANMSMMAVDVCRALPVAPAPGKGGEA